jgi:hypothetical protein
MAIPPNRLVVRSAVAANAPLTLDVKGTPVLLTVKPYSSVLREQAEWAARHAVRNLPEDASDAERTGAFFAAFVGQLGRQAIVGWDVVDETGAAVPCDPTTIETVLAFNPDLAREFDKAYAAANAVRAAEGNVSGPAPNGILAAGPITANPATASAIAPNAPI